MRGQYPTHCGFRPRPSGCSEAVAAPARFFLCARCRERVLICSCCDRGQVYCAGGCAQAARRQAQRAAGARYQASRRGRLAHALRARRYRRRRRVAPVSQQEEAMLEHRRQKIVTHQGSPSAPPDDLLCLDQAAAKGPPSTGDFPKLPPWRCCWCGSRCPDFVRQDFLRRRRWFRTAARGPEHDDFP